MKLEPNHIDDLFGQRLRNAEVTPPAFVWANVERELRKRRRRFFIWLFAFGLAGAGLWAMVARHHATTSVTDTAQQIFSENKKEAAVGETLPRQGQELEPKTFKTARLPVPSGPTKTSSAKGATTPPSQYVPALESQKDITVNSLLASNNDPVPMTPDAIQPHKTFPGFLPLNNPPMEPLVFSRKHFLPKAKPFVRKKKDPKYCYDFAQHPNVWLVDAYAGPSFTKRTLETSNPSFESYRQMRLATEQRDWAFNAGLRGSLLFGRHFLLRTGAHYEQLAEVFEYADPAYVKYLVEITHTVIDNKPVTIIDTIGVEYGENYTKTYNRYGLLDIPLEVGGEIRSGRFGLSINAGVSFNVLFWKRGSILSQNGKPTSFTPGKQGAAQVFRPRAGLSAGASAQVFFHLQPRVRLFAEPYFRQVLKPITLDGQPVEQRYRIGGVKIGVTKILD